MSQSGPIRPRQWPRAADDQALADEEDEQVKERIAIHTDEDYDRAQQRVTELNASPDSAEKDRELQAIADAMLAFELRRDEGED